MSLFDCVLLQMLFILPGSFFSPHLESKQILLAYVSASPHMYYITAFSNFMFFIFTIRSKTAGLSLNCLTLFPILSSVSDVLTGTSQRKKRISFLGLRENFKIANICHAVLWILWQTLISEFKQCKILVPFKYILIYTQKNLKEFSCEFSNALGRCFWWKTFL